MSSLYSREVSFWTLFFRFFRLFILYYYVLLLKTVNVEIINISNLTIINDIKNKNHALFQINFESYFNIKNNIFESIEELSKLEEEIKNIIVNENLIFY